MRLLRCGSSAIGRARSFQVRGCEFESRLPLKDWNWYPHQALWWCWLERLKWSSILQMCILARVSILQCPYGEIGKHAWLRIKILGVRIPLWAQTSETIYLVDNWTRSRADQHDWLEWTVANCLMGLGPKGVIANIYDSILSNLLEAVYI